QAFAFGCDPINTPVSFAILHLVATHDRIIPIRNVDSTVWSDRYIAGAKPLTGIIIYVVPFIIFIHLWERTYEICAGHSVARARWLGFVPKNYVPSRIGTQQHPSILETKFIAFIHDHTRG